MVSSKSQRILPQKQKHLLNMSLLISLNRELHEKMDEKDRQIAELQLQLEQRDEHIKQQFQQLDGKVDRKLQQLDGRVEHLLDLMHHTREFTVTNFSQLKGKGTSWISDPFHYSFMLGYKFKFRVFFASTTWMGVRLFLLPGEHDDKLSFNPLQKLPTTNCSRAARRTRCLSTHPAPLHNKTPSSICSGEVEF